MLIKQWEAEADIIYDRYIAYLYDLELFYELSDDMTTQHSYYNVMHFDFAHVVWEDGAFESHHVEWCVNEGISSELHIRFKKLLTRSLKELLLLPKYEECEDYGNE